MNENFYKDKYFDQLTEQITALQRDFSSMREKFDSMDRKVTYIYGFAAAIGFGTSLAVTWISHKLGFNGG